MKLIVNNKPFFIKEAALLCEKAYKNGGSNDFKIVREPEKYGLSILDINRRYGEYQSFLTELLDEMDIKIKEYSNLKAYMKIVIDKHINDMNILTDVIVSYIDDIEQLSFEEFKSISLKILQNNESNYTEEIAITTLDYPKIYSVIESHELSLELKYSYIDFFYKIEQVYYEYIELLKYAEDLIAKSYYKIEAKTNELIAKRKENELQMQSLSQINMPYISNLIEIKDLEEIGIEVVNYYISIIGYNMLTISFPDQNMAKGQIIEGLFVEELLELEDSRSDLESSKKKLLAIGDNTRFEIIKLLADKPHYLKELSDELGLTSATISHHIQQLINNEIIKVEVDGRKAYYHINRKTMSNLGEVFKSLGEKDYDRFKSTKKIYEPLKSDYKLIIMNFINAICGGLLPLVGIMTISIISGEILKDSVDVDKIITLIAMILSLGLLLSIGEVVTHNLSYMEFNQYRANIFGLLIKKITTMDFNLYEDPTFMDRVNTVINGVSSNDIGVEGIYHKVFELGKFIVTGVALIYTIFQVSIYIILIVLAALVCEYFFNQNIAKYKFSKREELANINRKAKFYATSASDFTYGKDMRTYPVERLFSEYYNRENENFKEQSRLFRKREVSLSFAQVLAIVIADTLSLMVLMKSVGNNIDITQFIFYMGAITVLMATLRRIFLDFSIIKENIMYAKEVYLFLEDNLITEGGIDIDLNGNAIELKFENVSFTYPNSEREIFKNISFTINKGESVALVGVNGAGKTSLVKLITGLYEPDSGNIYFNGINAKDFTKESRYKLFATVFQDVNPVAFTVAQNVSSELDDERIDRNRVEKCLDEVGLLEKIKSQNNGIDSMMLKIIDANGVVMSGGENQKLLIARALYKEKTSMLILDEPTAALDALAEEKIYRELEEIMSGRTTLFISHRLASTKFCDRIILLSGGEIVEDGTHDELIALNGLYKEMYEVQGKYYKEVINEESKHN